MKPLLVLVDFQKVYVSTSGIEPSIGSVVDRAGLLLNGCRECDVPIAHIRTAVPQNAHAPVRHRNPDRGWKPCANSPAYQAPSALVEKPGEYVIHKLGYSGFREAAMKSILNQHQVDTVFIAGVYTHACIRQTVIDAIEEDRKVLVVADAVASDDPLHAAITRRYLETRSVRFISVKNILESLAGRVMPNDYQEHVKAVNAAVSSAANYGAKWRHSERVSRVMLVRKLIDCLADESTALVDLVTDELGKPVQFSETEIRRTREMLVGIVNHSVDHLDRQSPGPATVRRRPHGTVAVVTPFNNPVYIPLGKIAPAILYGNTVVWKPAPETVRVSRLVMTLLRRADWPDGLVTLLEGGGNVGQALVHDSGIDAITITGSSMAGFSAQEAAATRRIPLQAELGGNNAAIVWHDAGLPEAAAAIAGGAFDMAGQRCTASRRVIVHHRIYEPFVKLLVAATKELPCGDPLDRATRIGPLVNSDRRNHVDAMVNRALADVDCIYRPPDKCPEAFSFFTDRWYPPTILCCRDAQHEIVQEETFGPVLVVQPADDWPQAIDLCNGVRQGLAAAVFTQSPDITRFFLDEARAGILKVNQSTADAAVGVSFGGWKTSGLGPPEHGQFDVEFYTRPQTIYDHSFEDYSS